MMRRMLLAAVVLLFSRGLVAAAEPEAESLATVKKQIDAGQAVLVDVRTADEWSDGHLKAARHLPLIDLRQGIDADELAKRLPKGKPVYLHCASGFRAKTAGNVLAKHGYKVHPLPNSYEELVEAGFEEAVRD